MKTAEFKLVPLREVSPTNHRLTTDTPDKVYEYLHAELPKSERYSTEEETFTVVLLNTRRRVIGHVVISIGTLDSLLVHARQVFRAAIIANASAIVLAHNHPSGDPSPSEADIRVTRDLIKAGQLLKIEVVDHVILGDVQDGRTRPFTSLRELGYFYQ